MEYLHLGSLLCVFLYGSKNINSFLSSGKFNVCCTRYVGFGQDSHCSDFSCFCSGYKKGDVFLACFNVHAAAFRKKGKE